MINEYQAKYYSYELSKRCSSDSSEKFGATLLDAKVDLNPHQVEAALFAFKSPLSKGAILADEVGLGKTIEAGILLSQKWAEGKRRILIIAPSSLRKQWSQELADKFYLPSTVIETRSFNSAVKRGKTNPFDNKNNIIICSYHFARNKAEWVQLTSWDLVVIDEAHYLRNSYKTSNVIGNTLRNALDGKRKILLTATPLQNSILELYGLTSFIDENIFGDIKSFRSQFTRSSDIEFEDLRDRIAPICKRTLRRQVQEYINYTNRIPITEKFIPTDEEHALYEMVTDYLQKDRLYALPASQRHLMTLILRKLLASSSFAISGTLENLIKRLNAVIEENDFNLKQIEELDSELSEDFELYDELQDEVEESNLDLLDDNIEVLSDEQIEGIKAELEELKAFHELAISIQHNAKGDRLLIALNKGFEKLKEIGGNQKTIIFTESRRTQSYLFDLLESNGYSGKIALFNGSNNDNQSRLIYKSWIEQNQNSDKITGSKAVDIRAALVDHFKSDDCQILLATEAAAEGINLQFCSMLVNYDLPWNPQRIEQRIGRCHRYGQKFDVVVVNFLNTRNAADQRVFALLNEKFNLFNGVFGASDDVLGSISSGVDFEKRIAEIYQNCRTKEEIELSFDNLQKELEDQIDSKIKTTQQKLLEHFDADVIDKLKTRLDEAKTHISKYEQWLWEITKLGLDGNASFDSKNLSFRLNSIPFRDKIKTSIPIGPYTLEKHRDDIHRYRIGHPIAQFLIKDFKSIELNEALLTFNYSDTKLNVSSIEHLVGKSGIIHLSNFEVTSFDITDNLLFVGFTNEGDELPNEVCKRILELPVNSKTKYQLNSLEGEKMNSERVKHKELLIEALQTKDNEYFQLEVDKLHKWADDKILASEKELKDVKSKIKEINRDTKKTSSSDALLKMQTELRDLERKKKRLRQEIFEVEDEIEERRDEMINAIKAKMLKAINESSIFTIKWKLV
jgi:ERCC4-related helicase